MPDHKQHAKKTEKRMCDKHKDEPYSLGCQVCLKVICTRCLSGLSLCQSDSSHKLLPLDELVTALTKETKRADIVQMEKKLEKLVKQTSKFSSVYDTETTELIQLLHTTRDEQINGLRHKYNKLEEELIEARQKTKMKTSKFLEVTILNKWTTLHDEWLRIESLCKHGHQVDKIKAIKDMNALVQKLKKEDLPALKLDGVLAIQKTGEMRDVELGVTLSGAIIDGEHGATTYPSLLKAPELLNTVDLPAAPRPVSQCSGTTFVGLNNSYITKIEQEFKLNSSFVDCNSGSIKSVAQHDGKVYTLISVTGSDFIKVYDCSGKQVTCWTQPGSAFYNGNKLVILSDQIVATDQNNQRLAIYSLTGALVKHVHCSLLATKGMAMCTLDNSSIVLSNKESSKVHRVDISSGQAVWTCGDVHEPQGVACYAGQYILVANKEKTIQVLTAQTGVVVFKLAPRGLPAGSKYGLAVDGNELVVSNYDKKTIQYYLLCR